MILGAIALHYLFAGLPRASLWGGARVISIFGLLLAVYFLLAYNWQTLPVQIASGNNAGGIVAYAVKNRIAQGWMSFHPELWLPVPDSDQTAGILAILAPFPFVQGLRKLRSSWRRSRGLPALDLALDAVTLAAIGLALVLASERGPWLSLGIVAGLWIWAAVCQSETGSSLANRLRWSRSGLFITGLVLAGLLGLVLIINYPGGLVGLGDSLPGPTQANSRANLWHDTIKLIGDFPFTGGGLASFSGLYSQYILWIPYEFIDSSHHLFLEVAIQQGVPGLLSLVMILVGSLRLVIGTLWSRNDPARRAIPGAAGDEPQIEPASLLRAAILSGLLVLVLHGLVEDALYSGVDVLFLFLLPGFARAAGPMTARRSGNLPTKSIQWKRWQAAGLAALLGLLALAGSRPLLAQWYANLGAVYMARVQLVDYPTGRFEDGRNLPALAQAEALLKKALRFNPHERTAQHRLGLIALEEAINLQGDFREAADYLEKAYQADGANTGVHRGIRKALGYTYIWSGDVDRAMLLLLDIHETRHEMAQYIVWWQMHGRDDLARLSQQAMRAAESSQLREENIIDGS